MKKQLLSKLPIIACACALSLVTQSFTVNFFQDGMEDPSETVVNVRRVDFGSGNTVLTNAAGAKTTVPNADFAHFKFAKDPSSGIVGTVAGENGIAVTFDGSCIRSSVDASIEVYAANGILVAKAANECGIESLAPGMYIVRATSAAGTAVKKIAKKF